MLTVNVARIPYMALNGCKRALVTLVVLFSSWSSASAQAPTLSVADPHNRHNLSVSGPGQAGVTRATSEERVCIFCHAPHHASTITPLWSRDLSSAAYTPYVSSTLKATSKPGQPTGASRLCLSCHDGTIAPGMLTGGKLIAGLPALTLDRRSNLSTDLSDDHPISFPYASAITAAGGLRQPGELPLEIALDNGRLECTACHDPHRDRFPPADKPDQSGMFLVLDNNNRSALCTGCHNRAGLTVAAHYLPGDPCGNCHVVHRADQPFRLLRGTSDQDTCLLNCHNGSGIQADTGKDIRSTFSNGKAHVTGQFILSGRHDANENPLDFVANSPHVECVDCHNPCLTRHETMPLSSPPLINGRLAEVAIAKDADGLKTMAVNEYDVCAKCHAENSFTPAAVPRQIQTGDEMQRFAQENPSFHPVKALGKGLSVPSLRGAIAGFVPARSLSTQSLIYCTDCHNSNTSSKVGGSGPSGPHGSAYPHLLMDRYEQDTYPLPYAESNYALCFRCHDQDVLLDPARSAFPLHQSHLVTHQVPCSVCHDPHGVPLALGATQQANGRLINFDRRFVVTGSYDGTIRSCTVSCHQVNPKTY